MYSKKNIEISEKCVVNDIDPIKNKNSIFKICIPLKKKSISEKIERKQKLIKSMGDLKLSYEKFKDNKLCTSYINFGTPNLDTIIENINSKLSSENNRLCELLEELKLLNLEYDHNVPSYKKFIKKGGNIKEIINSAELEKDLMKDTNYLSFCEITDSDTAKEMVVSKMEVKTKRVKKYITKKNTIEFD